MNIKIAVSGAAGRMGQRLIDLSAKDRELSCVAAIETASCPELGRDAGELAGLGPLSLPLADRTEASFDVLIDFSTPDGTMQGLELCVARGRAMIIGTTGHDDSQRARIRKAAATIPVLMAPNMSIGVNVMIRVTQMLAEALDASYDVEITETHHRFKVDAPSGTALALRDAVCRGRSSLKHSDPSVVFGRRGKTGPRSTGEIGLHSLRIGDTVGEHMISFGTLGETVSLSHTAHSRDTFATGALIAAKWIVGRPPALYDMQDVLFSELSSAHRQNDS